MVKFETKLTVLLFLAMAFSCADKDEKNPLLNYDSSYDVIQGEIWDKSCVSCHTSGSSFARQSDLVLTSDVSYDQLVGRIPKNAAAQADGLELVGVNGLESIYKSFLWEKINAPDQEHFYADHPEYGALMPLGADFLTNGQLEFIRQWIVAGAPKDGEAADISLLKDDSRFELSAFEPLVPPTQGYQFHVGPFDVDANQDRELFVYQNLDNDAPVYINQVEIVMRSGSHHFLLYNFPDDFARSLLPKEGLVRDVYEPNGEYRLTTLYHMQFHQFVSGTQWPKMNYRFPPGVALEVPPNTGFDLNSHYANKTDQAVIGEVYANIYTIDESEVEHIAGILNLSHDNFVIPAKKITTLTKTFYTEEEIHIFQLFSHAHSHMTEFKVYIKGGTRDGELIYVAYDWEHPPILELDPPLTLGANQGVTLEVTYDNKENRDLRFGLRSTDEMMILFGAYYK